MSPHLRSGISALLLIAVIGGATHLWRDRLDTRLGAQLLAHAKPGDIEMISSVTCTYCAKARLWLNEHKVPFQECLIEQDAACAAKFEALPYAVTPTFLVRGQIQVGFDAQQVAQALVER